MNFFLGQFFDAVSGLFENRILGDFLRNHFLQLEPVQLQNRDHLDQARRQNLFLRDF